MSSDGMDAADGTSAALALSIEGLRKSFGPNRVLDGIDLAVEEMGFPPQYPQAKFERMRLRIDAGDLVPAWAWDMDAFRKDGERGRYERLEP